MLKKKPPCHPFGGLICQDHQDNKNRPVQKSVRLVHSVSSAIPVPSRPISTVLLLEACPCRMRTAERATPKCRLMICSSSSFALPSAGLAWTWTRQGSPGSTSDLLLPGITRTVICMRSPLQRNWAAHPSNQGQPAQHVCTSVAPTSSSAGDKLLCAPEQPQ